MLAHSYAANLGTPLTFRVEIGIQTKISLPKETSQPPSQKKNMNKEMVGKMHGGRQMANFVVYCIHFKDPFCVGKKN